ncbi:MAG TPA: dihydroxyacetone kinase subunit L, partial [Rhodobacteraceae bacterium]|nr:dihydroxyacetone kinase subunit L [Paracoccaceae bacterium]
MTGMTVSSLRTGLAGVAAVMEQAVDDLNACDARLGDGDIGVTMRRGMRGIMEIADDLPEDVGKALMKCAQAFTSVSGSSYGTLLATGLMSAAKACKGRTEIPWADMAGLVRGALEAMMARGKGQLGDKTVLDVLDAIATALEGKSDPAAMLAAADMAVDATMDAFRPLP